jgi:hypothetical protein
MKNDMPPSVFASVQSHLRAGCLRGEKGWESGHEEEDTLTGDLCGSLRTDGWVDLTDENGGRWKFQVTYKKFRGRGKGAEEKSFGTDGIVEVQIENVSLGTKFGKGLLFQSKKYGDKDKSRLRHQARTMEKVAAGGSAIFEYGPDKYTGIDSSQVLGDSINLSRTTPKARLGDYLADRFLPCESGKRGMFYNAQAREIVYADENGNVVRAHATLDHRLRIEITTE